MKEKLFKKAFNAIAKAERTLLITHVNADGDAYSSLCAMIDMMKRMDKDFVAYTRDEAPYQFFFLPHIENIENKAELIDIGKFDVIVSLDCGDLKRTNLADKISQRAPGQTFIEIDHHPKVEDVSDIEIRIPEMSSTAEILYNFFKINKVKFSKDMANCILTGIMTDTGNFLYPSTSDKTVQIASEMLLYGAKYPKVIENTWRNKSMVAMKLWGEVLGNLQVNPKYNMAFSVISHETFKKSEATEEDLESISGFLSNLYGVNGVIFLRESKSGEIRGSLRSVHPQLDISKFAQALGGGGHAKAAGFSFPGHIQKNGQSWKIV
jgi:phosphoesterase RecJ-like protein